MSHFTVLVIGHNWEEQLAPYQENNMGSCPREYMEFQSREEEWRQEYDDEEVEMYFDPGSGAFYEEPDDKNIFEAKMVPVKTVKTFEEFADEMGYDKDTETGEYGYWENPNCKWDWYTLGGRWSGLLRVKPGKNGERGSPGIMGTVHSDEKLAVDQCLKGDLDLEGMRETKRQNHIRWWNESKVRYIESGGLEGKTFEECLKQFGERLNTSREAWEALDETSRGPFYQLLDQDKEYIEARQALDFDAVGFFSEPWPENPTEELYVENGSRRALSTFAVLKDGEWYEKGEMGWWAMVANEKSEEEWEEQFNQLIEDLPDDTLLSVVDCHI